MLFSVLILLNNIIVNEVFTVNYNNCAIQKFLSYAYYFMVSFLGNACRDKVRRYLRVNFKNISDAEEAYSINYFHDD